MTQGPVPSSGPPDAPPDPPPVGDASPEPESGIDRWILPYFTDSMLWPVLVTAVGCFVTIGAFLLVLAFEGRNGFAIAALVIIAWASADGLRLSWKSRGSAGKRGLQRLGPAGGLILALWALSLLTALAASRSGIF